MSAERESTLRRAIEVDLAALDVRSGVIGLVVLTAALVPAAVVGPAWLAAGIAALLVVAGTGGDVGSSLWDEAAFVLVGGAATLVVGWAAPSGVAASLVIGAIALVTTLALLRGPVAATSGAFLLMWSVIALSIVDSDATAPAMAGAFLVGGALALGALWVARKVDPTRGDGPHAPPADRTAVLRYATVRAVGAGGCVGVGYWLFPGHAAWAALAFVLVLRPPREQAIVAGIGRTLGTVAGVLLGMALAGLVGGSDLTLLVAFALCAFAMLATSKVSYAVSTAFTTAVLLIAQRLIEADVVATGAERLGATVVGVVVAFIALAAVRAAGATAGDAAR